ncbi:MAG: hypothetical protein HY731_03250 [Candidatus Tectomicrobia bacterium]|nr:hypothetical protein [Candidatus Tectomicrobia bacterium]
MKQLGTILVISILFSVGCGRLFSKATMEKIEGKNVLIVKGPFEPAWEAVIGALAVNNIPIKTLERGSGRIESDLTSLDPKQRYTTCDRKGVSRSRELGMSFLFLVETMSEGKTMVRLTSLIHELSGGGNPECSSTGEFEQKLFSSVRNQLSQQKDSFYSSSQRPFQPSSPPPPTTGRSRY